MKTTVNAMDSVSQSLATAIDAHRIELLRLSHELHDDPELGSQEFRAADRLRTLLEDAGFALEKTPAGLPTAFCATAGSGPLVVAICVEYDALPGIGHGCGHNVNAASAIGAALALRPLLDGLGLGLVVLGTPAEETTGAKADLIELGYFDEVSFAMMAHASAEDAVGGSSLALTLWDAKFTGHPAHAAAEPDMGVNALDAVLVAQTAIALGRQQLPKDAIVSTNITEGGTAVNVIPAQARCRVEMRSPNSQELQRIQDRVRRCLEAGAHATGCELELTTIGNDFDDLRQDAQLCNVYRSVMSARGREVRLTSEPAASTDMGNVSHVVPTIHPMIGLDAEGAAMHTAEFAAAAVTASADRAVLDAAFGLAATAAKVALDPAQRERLLERAAPAAH